MQAQKALYMSQGDDRKNFYEIESFKMKLSLVYS